MRNLGRLFLPYAPLAAHMIATLIIGFGVVIPGSPIDGWNAYTFGFLAAVIGFFPTYVAGIAMARRPTTCPLLRRPYTIARQARQPIGALGYLVAWIMQRETTAANERVVALLGVRSGDTVLDIGTGNGRSLGLIAALAERGLAVGVDHSAVMCARARCNNRSAIAIGRVRVEQAHSDHLPFEAASFEAAISVHTIYFWDPLEPHLAEIARVLRPGGRLVLAFRPPDDPKAKRFPASVYCFRSAQEVEALLTEVGFEVTENQREESAAGITLFMKAERKRQQV